MKRAKTTTPTPKERMIADRVARARAAHPPRDTSWYERCGEFAQDNGLNPGDVFDEFDERAGIYEYDANVSRADAEERAFRDTCAVLRRQHALAI